MVTDEAKRVLHAFRDGRRFSVGMVQDANESTPRQARSLLERLARLGYVVRAPVGPADLYRLTVTGRDLGQHLADTASAYTRGFGRTLPYLTEKMRYRKSRLTAFWKGRGIPAI